MYHFAQRGGNDEERLSKTESSRAVRARRMQTETEVGTGRKTAKLLLLPQRAECEEQRGVDHAAEDDQKT
jgi:hypothetical protein